jgi:hypothetical protein
MLVLVMNYAMGLIIYAMGIYIYRYSDNILICIYIYIMNRILVPRVINWFYIWDYDYVDRPTLSQSVVSSCVGRHISMGVMV